MNPPIFSGRLKFPKPLQRFQNLGDLLGTLGIFLAELRGEGFRVLTVGRDELLNRGDLSGQGGGPDKGGAGFVRLEMLLRFGACQGAL